MSALSPQEFEFIVEASLSIFNAIINKRLKEGWCIYGPAKHSTGTDHTTSTFITHRVKEYHSQTLVRY